MGVVGSGSSIIGGGDLVMEKIKVVKGATYAVAEACFPCGGTTKAKDAWIVKHDLFTDTDGRAFALVENNDRVYFMDAVTGSLYQFGRYVSGALTVNDLRRNKAAAEAYLMRAREKDGGLT